MTKGQEEFIDQMSRKLMVDWCHESLRENGAGIAVPERLTVYRDHAVTKKWLSAPDGMGECRILAAGWETAARFLKR